VKRNSLYRFFPNKARVATCLHAHDRANEEIKGRAGQSPAVQYLLLYFFLIIFIIFHFSSCRREPVPVQVAERNLNAVITFISGDAYIFSENTILPAAIGDILSPGDTVRTATDSFLEILITGNSVIRMDGNTELSIDRLAIVGADSDVVMSLVSGTIINKVERMVGSDHSIRTNSAVFGVRGTEFLVSASGADSDDIVLAVRSGSVQMIPHLDVVERIMEKAPEGDENIEAFIQLVEERFPLVAGGSEIVITPDLSAEILTTLLAVENAVDNLIRGNIVIRDFHEIILNSSAAIISDAEKALALVQDISEANLEKLRITDFMQIHDQDETLKEVIFRTEPARARIYFDGVFIGLGSVNALLAERRTIRVSAEHEGYEVYEKEFIVSEIAEKPYIITLRPKEPARGYFEISVSPSDAEIFIGGRSVGRGRHIASYSPGTMLNVSLQRREFRTENLSVEIREGETLRRNIALEALLIPYTFDTGFSSLDRITPAGRNHFVFVSSGNGFSVVDTEGRVLFRNNDAAAAAPVFAGGNLLFVSGDAFRAINTVTWREAGVIELDATAAPFREPVVHGNLVLINSGDSILVINGNNFEVSRRIRVPDTVVSYPFFYNNRVLTVTNRGVLQIFGHADYGSQAETPISSIPVTLGSPQGMGIAVSSNIGYFANVNGSVNAIDLQTGSFLWEGRFRPAAADALALGRLPQISASERGVIIYSNNTLKFFNPRGEEVREIERVKSFCTLEGTLVYVVSESPAGRITAYNPVNGVAVKHADTGMVLKSIVFRDGRIHGATRNGQYVIINPAAFTRQ